MAPDGAGIINYGTNKNVFKEQGDPWEVKGHKGAPWWRQGVAPY
jgi:hypothetical protein